MPDKFINLNPEIYFWVYKLSSTEPANIYKKELGTEFTNLFRKELIEYAKNSYNEYEKELQKAHNKLPKICAKKLDEVLLKINKDIRCKEETCLDPYDPHRWPHIYQYTYINHFKTTIIRSINKHFEELNTKQTNYGEEIMNIMYVLRSLSKPNVYGALLAVHMLVESFALRDISSSPENSSINDKIIKQIKQFKSSNNVQNYISAIQKYSQKQIELIDLAYQRASEYIEDTIEDLFRKNTDGFNKKIESALLRYLKGIY